MQNLNKEHCVPCERGTKPLADDKILELRASLRLPWEIVPAEDSKPKRLKVEILLPDFLAAIAFINQVADIAETEGHHPDIYIFYNKIIFELYTHAATGLTQNDFILATKIDEAFLNKI